MSSNRNDATERRAKLFEDLDRKIEAAIAPVAEAFDDLLSDHDENLSVIANSMDAIVTANMEGNVTKANPAAVKMFGYDYDTDIIGQSIEMLMPEEFRVLHRDGFARFKATGESILIGVRIGARGLRRDGSTFPIEIVLSGWTSRRGRFVSATMRMGYGDAAARSQG